MSNMGVADPDKWHQYPAGAHHLLTECSPSLHAMITQHRPDLLEPDSPTQPRTPVEHAKAFARQYVGLRVQDPDYETAQTGEKTVTYPDLVQAFANCADSVIDEHVRQQREKARLSMDGYGRDYPVTSSYHWAARIMSLMVNKVQDIDIIADEFQAAMAAAVDEYVQDRASMPEGGIASEGTSEAPEEQSETLDHICARSIIVRFINGSEEVIHTHHPLFANGGWTFRNLNGVPYLVIGHRVPRRQYPLYNIAFIELSPEQL